MTKIPEQHPIGRVVGPDTIEIRPDSIQPASETVTVGTRKVHAGQAVYVKRLTGIRAWWTKLRGKPLEVAVPIEKVKLSNVIYHGADIPDGQDPAVYLKTLARRDDGQK